MKLSLFIATNLFFSTSLQAQFTGHYNALNITGTTNTLKSEIPLAAPIVIGSTYLDDNWQPAKIILKDGHVIQEFLIRVEIEQGNVEIKYNGDVKFLNLDKVDSLKLMDTKIGSKTVIKKENEFTINDVPLKGIVRVYPGGRYSVVKHFYIEFLPANYNAALDIGSQDHRKVKKEKLYLSHGSKLIMAKGSNKKLLGQLGMDKEKALEIIKEGQLNLSKEIDLIIFCWAALIRMMIAYSF